MPSPLTRDARRASRSILRRLCRAALLMLVMGAASVAPARGAELRIEACQCLTVPGEPLDVRLFVDNPGPNPAAMLLALHTPDDEWRFYSPAGLIPAAAWLPIPARMPRIEVPLLDLDLEPDSLPFGHHPLVGPFRFELVALLFDAVTFELLAPVAANWFEFLPAPPATPPAGPGMLHLIVHQHNELAWLEREDVYLPLGAAFVRDAITQADRDPRYRFVVDQMPVLERFRADYPALVPRLRALFDAGAAEASGGHLVESDLNLLSGESIARQAIYGQRYLESQWGQRARGAWHLDAFGHPHQMPQLTKKAGMDTYTFARGVADLGALGGSEFHWESPDGSRVLAHYMPHFYQLGREIGSRPETSQELNELFALLGPPAATPNLLGPVGADVGENVFNDFVPEAIDAWNPLQAPGVMARLSTPSEFFADVEASGIPLAVASDVEFQSDPDGSRVFPGVDATRIEIKKTNARLEQQLLDVEKLATLASLVGRPYPEAQLEAQGIALALNQTHDYLPGSGVDEIYADADAEIDDLGDRFAAVEAALGAEQSAAIDHLRARIDTTRAGGAPRTAIIVFNTMAWQRDDLVRIALADPAAVLPARLVDARGAEIPYQLLAAQGGVQEIVFVASVPATGWATFWLVPGTPSQAPTETGALLTARSVALGGYSVDVDAGAFVRQIRGAASGTPLLAAGGERAGDVGWFEEKFGNAYEIDPLESGASWTSSFPQTAYVLEGPVVTRLLAVGPLANASIVVREVLLVPALERIDFATTIYWADANRNVRVRFPFAAIPGAVRTEGVPYGHFERADGDFPALGWFDLGSDARGISLLNRGLFAHRLASTPDVRTLDVTLLRSLDRAVFGDRPSVSMLEHGIHRAEYAIAPREESWRAAAVPRLAAAWSAPLIARETSIHTGALAPERAHLEIETGSEAIATVLQRSGASLVVRLYETGGMDSTHALHFPTLTAASMTETDLLGDPIAALGSGSRAVVQTTPEEIVTIRLDGISNLPAP